MTKFSISSASRGGGKAPHASDDDSRIRVDGYLHPREYLWVMQNKFKPGEDIPQPLINCYRGAILAWQWFPAIHLKDFGDQDHREGPYVI